MTDDDDDELMEGYAWPDVTDLMLVRMWDEVDVDELISVFAEFGDVAEARQIYSNGVPLLELRMATIEDGTAAIRGLQNRTFKGHPLHIHPSMRVKPYSGPVFQEGDCGYLEEQNDAGEVEYHPFRILVLWDSHEIYHVRSYEILSKPPTLSDFSKLKVTLGHAPMAFPAYRRGVIVGNKPVQEDELDGFRIYMESIQPEDDED